MDRSGSHGRQVCIVVSARLGDDTIALMTRVAGWLEAAGATVTVLRAEDGAAPAPSIALPPAAVPLPPAAVPLAPCAPHTELSWRCRAWLAGQGFDLVLFPERGGLAYYSALARRQGLALAGTAVAIVGCCASLWHAQADGQLIDDFDLLVADYQERRSVELADAVIAGHGGLLEWMRAAGWSLPAESLVAAPPPACAPLPAAAGPVGEVVYVGDLDRGHGLLAFCAALDRIAPRLAEAGVTVRFLGEARPGTDFDPLDHLRERAGRWPFAPVVEAVPLAAERLAERLRPDAEGRRRLAVLPALALGDGWALREVLALGVPLLVGAAAGAAELVHPEDRDAVMTETTPPVLAERLAAALAAPPTARPAPGGIDGAALLDRLMALAPLPAAAPPEPCLVSVCLSHFNRPHLLERAVASVLAQDWQPLEIIVVDDGSTADNRRKLDALQAQWGDRVTVIRQDNRYLGAARNRAAAAARGEYLLFMDDDNVAMPEEVSTMVTVARRTGADVLTTVINLFEDDEALARGAAPTGLWVPLGGAVSAGLYSNVFGDANALIRRSAFQAVGGFSEAYGLGLEDWELFARLALAGYRFDVVATPLLWYRQNSGGMLLASINRPAELRRAASGYAAAVPPALRPALQFAQGVHYRQSYYRDGLSAAAALAEERLTVIEGMDAMIRQRDEAIFGQASLIEERWRAMQAMERLIDEKNEAISAQAHMLEERWEAMAAMGREIAARDAVIAERDAVIAARDAAIAERDAVIAERDAVIAERIAALAAIEERLKKLRDSAPVRLLRRLGMLGNGE